MTDRPNILYIITDQHRSDWLGCAGHPVVNTPNIDALAAAGTRIGDFQVATPVCMPNRASILTGRMPSVHGLRYNGCRLPLNANTFVDILSKAGYHTAAIGKSHIQPMTADTPIGMTDDTVRLVDEAWAPEAGDYTQEQPEHYASDGSYAFETPYYGYQHVDMVTLHGDRCGGHYAQWFRENCPEADTLWDDASELPHNYTCPQAFRTPVPEEYYPTTWIADRAIAYLDGRKGTDQPFYSFVSFPDPHHPFNPPGKYWDMYDPDDFEVALPYEAHQNPTPPMQWMAEQHEKGGAALTRQTARRVDEQGLKQAMALTAGMITMIDDQVGRIVAALKANGQYDNTIIIFNSDHGDYLGDYNLLLKGMLPFRSITQVPFIWSDPADRKGQVVDTMASTIDIPATILERVGLEPFRGMQGRSFLETIQTGAGHRDEVYLEYNDGMPRLGFDRPARVRVLRTPEWRFTLYGGQDWGELYDLTEDPSESNNLWDSPDHAAIKADLSLRLNHHLTAQMDESPVADRQA